MKITFTVETERQLEKILDVVTEAELEGEIDFPFNTKTSLKPCLEVENIDERLLEDQRLSLPLVNYAAKNGLRAEKVHTDNVEGLQNMLDEWSDNNFLKKWLDRNNKT